MRNVFLCIIIVIFSPCVKAEKSNLFLKLNVGQISITDGQWYSELRRDIFDRGFAKRDIFLGGGLGYNLMNNLRVDITWDHFFNPVIKKNDQSVSGKVDTMLLNVFTDIFDISITKMFIGAGIGKSRIDADSKIEVHDNVAALYVGGVLDFTLGISVELLYRRIVENPFISRGQRNKEYNYIKGSYFSASVRCCL